MSYSILYSQEVRKVPKDYGLPEDLYIWFVESGSNNTYDDVSTGKRSRNWNIYGMGDKKDLIKSACNVAGGFFGGNLKVSGRTSQANDAEWLIGKVRKMSNTVNAPHRDYKEGLLNSLAIELSGYAVLKMASNNIALDDEEKLLIKGLLGFDYLTRGDLVDEDTFLKTNDWLRNVDSKKRYSLGSQTMANFITVISIWKKSGFEPSYFIRPTI